MGRFQDEWTGCLLNLIHQREPLARAARGVYLRVTQSTQESADFPAAGTLNGECSTSLDHGLLLTYFAALVKTVLSPCDSAQLIASDPGTGIMEKEPRHVRRLAVGSAI
jgi:hypothetical protein